MLQPETALHAVQLLGADVATLMTKIAIYQATAEELFEAVEAIDVRLWVPDDDQGQHTGRTYLPADQAQAVMRIMTLIDALR